MDARRGELTAQLHQVERELAQLDVTVVVSQWWQAPSGTHGRGTAFHKRGNVPCRPTNKPAEISLHEALRSRISTDHGTCGSNRFPAGVIFPVRAHEV
ncbi:hypothetical protein ACIP4N_29285, partial [Streptomyces sp. NPDC088864]